MSVELTDPRPTGRAEEILTDDALAFVAELHQRFAPRREELLSARGARREQAACRPGHGFPPRHEERARRGLDRRPRPAGPDRPAGRDDRAGHPAKMAINALNSGAKVWLADLEDASCPTWANVIDALLNLRDAARGTLSFTQATTVASTGCGPTAARGRGHAAPGLAPVRGAPAHRRAAGRRGSGRLRPALLPSRPATARQRPRALLLPAQAGEPPRGPAVERRLQLRRGAARHPVRDDPGHRADRDHPGRVRDGGDPLRTARPRVGAERRPLGLPVQHHQVLPRRRSGLRAGRPGRHHHDCAVHARVHGAVGATCHRRGAFAMGGMAAFIPSRKDEEINRVAFAKVTADKTREAEDGFDGSWVAHPDLVPVCREVFDRVLGDKPNQLDRRRDEVEVSAGGAAGRELGPGRQHRSGPAQQPVCRGGLHRGLAVRQRRRRHPQPDGGRGHRGDLPIPGLAGDPEPGRLSDTGETVTRELVARLLDEEAGGCAARFRRNSSSASTSRRRS